jgi:hypothetical protein
MTPESVDRTTTLETQGRHITDTGISYPVGVATSSGFSQLATTLTGGNGNVSFDLGYQRRAHAVYLPVS